MVTNLNIKKVHWKAKNQVALKGQRKKGFVPTKHDPDPKAKPVRPGRCTAQMLPGARPSARKTETRRGAFRNTANAKGQSPSTSPTETRLTAQGQNLANRTGEMMNHETLTLLIAHAAHCGYLRNLKVKLNCLEINVHLPWKCGTCHNSGR